LLSVDPRSDLAALRVQGLKKTAVGIRADRARVGEDVAAAGYPLPDVLSGFNLTRGNVSSLSGLLGDTRLLQITAPIQQGNSGGPLVDDAGNLVGVIVSKLSWKFMVTTSGVIPENVNFAINGNALMSFLDASNLSYQRVSSSGKGLSPVDMADRTRGYTVFVQCWSPG